MGCVNLHISCVPCAWLWWCSEQIADSASGRDIMDLKTPATPAAGTPMDFVIEIKEVKDLCSPFANNVFLSFQFFGEKDPIVSEVMRALLLS